MQSLNLSFPADPHIDQPAEQGAVALAFERSHDGVLVDALIDAAFGPGRFAKAAERLREGGEPRLDLSICAWSGDRLVGVVRQWAVMIGDTPAVFLGPFAVAADQRGRGLGSALIERALSASVVSGEPLTLLVGDAPFFRPFGFETVEPGRVRMPGPVDPRRLMWRATGSFSLAGVAGAVRPAEWR